MKLSIVVPIYNAAKYLGECLDSLLAIHNEYIEVICVNDGSTDNSLDIIKEYAQLDTRIKVLDKENSGYGDSLNRGIEMAEGDYIGIVESDDIVIPGAFETLISYAERYNVDVVKGNYNLYYSEDEIKFFENFEGNQYEDLISPRENWKVFLSAPALWSGIYKKEFLDKNGIRLIPSKGATYQDTSFMFKVWCAAEKIFLINQPIINYRQTNATSSSNTSDKIFNIFVETNAMRSYALGFGNKDLLSICMRTKWESFAWNLSRLKGSARGKFLTKVFYDIRQDFYDGYLDKQYWDEQNWGIVFNILTNIENVISDNIGSPGYEVLSKFALDKYDDLFVFEDVDEQFKNRLVNLGVSAKTLMIKDGKLLKIKDGKYGEVVNADQDIMILMSINEPDLHEKVGVIEQKQWANYLVW